MTVPLPDYNGLIALAADASGMTPTDLAEAAVACQDSIAALRLLERVFTDALGKTSGKHSGSVGDGRQYEVIRSADRKEWDHADWQRDVRRKIVDGLPPSVVLVDVTTGEDFHRSLEYVVSEALIAAQQVHGAGAPRSRDLKSLGLYASDYCTTSPAGWRLTSVRPDADQATTLTTGPAETPRIPTQREAS